MRGGGRKGYYKIAGSKLPTSYGAAGEQNRLNRRLYYRGRGARSAHALTLPDRETNMDPITNIVVTVLVLLDLIIFAAMALAGLVSPNSLEL